MGTTEMAEVEVEVAGVEVEVAGEKVQLQDSIHKLPTQQCIGNLILGLCE